MKSSQASGRSASQWLYQGSRRSKREKDLSCRAVRHAEGVTRRRLSISQFGNAQFCPGEEYPHRRGDVGTPLPDRTARCRTAKYSVVVGSHLLHDELLGKRGPFRASNAEILDKATGSPNVQK